MIIPSIDLMNGNAVQLIGGKEKAIDAGDPRPIAKQFALAGEIAVIDLDAALSQGSNEDVICDLLKIAPCRVGGGIRDIETAIKWLDRGAAKVILGTRAVPEILRELPKERVIAALDASHGEVVVEGWTEKTGKSVIEQISLLKDYVGGFLVTFVEREGQLKGVDFDRVNELLAASSGVELTVAGGVNSVQEIAKLDLIGADAQVGMALYGGHIELADCIAATLLERFPDELWPTIVSNERGVALGLVWSNKESVREAVKTMQGVYHSRTRGLWHKGKTSGAYQDLLRISLDCDKDALRFTVRQHGKGFCHKDTATCWGKETGVAELIRVIEERTKNSPKGSYTSRLLNDTSLLNSKLLEEVKEFCEAETKDEIIHEASDLLYFTLVKLAKNGVSLAQIESELDTRALRITRRPGDAKK